MNKNIEIQSMAEEVFKAMNKRDFTGFEQIITDDVVFDFPGAGRTEGSRRTLLLLKSILRKYPKLHFNISEIISQEDTACVVWTNEGEDIKGNPYSNAGITLLHFGDGKISFISDYIKDTSFADSER
jgi:ketosteroid isomerase-like protein